MIRLRTVFWDMVHNCLAHPLLSVTAYSHASRCFHTWTANKRDDAEVDAVLRRR